MDHGQSRGVTFDAPNHVAHRVEYTLQRNRASPGKETRGGVHYHVRAIPHLTRLKPPFRPPQRKGCAVLGWGTKRRRPRARRAARCACTGRCPPPTAELCRPLSWTPATARYDQPQCSSPVPTGPLVARICGRQGTEREIRYGFSATQALVSVSVVHIEADMSIAGDVDSAQEDANSWPDLETGMNAPLLCGLGTAGSAGWGRAGGPSASATLAAAAEDHQPARNFRSAIRTPPSHVANSMSMTGCLRREQSRWGANLYTSPKAETLCRKDCPE